MIEKLNKTYSSFQSMQNQNIRKPSNNIFLIFILINSYLATIGRCTIYYMPFVNHVDIMYEIAINETEMKSDEYMLSAFILTN